MGKNWQVSGSPTLRLRVYSMMLKSKLDTVRSRVNHMGSAVMQAMLSPHKG